MALLLWRRFWGSMTKESIDKILRILSKPKGTIIRNVGHKAFKKYSGLGNLVYNPTASGYPSKNLRIVCSTNELSTVLEHTNDEKVRAKIMGFILGNKDEPTHNRRSK